MVEFLLGAALVILGTVAVGLFRVLRGPANVDRLMSLQLLGTGGIAVLLLVGAGTGVESTVDVALTLALLAAFAAFAWVKARVVADDLDAAEGAGAAASPGDAK